LNLIIFQSEIARVAHVKRSYYKGKYIEKNKNYTLRKMKILKHLLNISIGLFIFYSCGSQQEKVEEESSFIEITSQQFAADAMQLGEIETKTFESSVKCNGSIVPLPKGIAIVNAPVSGVVKNIYCRNGQSVNKNQSLLEITGNEIIDIQEKFAEASSIYKLSKNEFERSKSLYAEKVITEKEFNTADSQYKTSLAKYIGLKMKIESMGFSLLKIENGEFSNSYAISSPINGNISNLSARIGSYIDSQSELLEIIDPNMFHLKLSVFAADLTKLKHGQTINFKTANSDNLYQATISSIGVTIENETKTIECYASITDKKIANFVANEFVETEIITSTDKSHALPDEAIIKTETGYSILVLDKQVNNTYYFKQVEINIGDQYNGYTKILTDTIYNKILTKGVYNISLQ
jgi:membrane fusion protein, heavy metal efflux system